MSNNQTKKLAIICGGGTLPGEVYSKAAALGFAPVCIVFDGQPSAPLLESEHTLMVKLGQVQPILDFLKSHNVTTITMAGSIKRPKIKDLSLDRRGGQWLGKLGASFFKGDDTLLKNVISLLSNEGFDVKPAHFFLDDVFLCKGDHSSTCLTQDILSDINKGIDILKVLSPFDIGQSTVIDQGIVLGIEAAEGTKELIDRIKILRSGANENVPSGILIKMRKQGQSELVDMPTIGIDTIDQIIKSGLLGIAFESCGVQILQKRDVLNKVEQENLIFHGF